MRAGVGLTPLVRSLFLALFAPVLEGINYALLIPTIHAFIAGGAEPIHQAPYLGVLIQQLPSVITDSNFNLIALLIGVIFLAALLKNVLDVALRVSVMAQTQRFTNQLRFLIFERFLCCGKSFFDEHHLGNLQNILMNYPLQIAKSFKALHQIFYSGVTLAVNLLILASISWKFTMAAALVWPFLNLPIRHILHQVRVASVRLITANAALAKKISNSLSCMTLIKACSSEEMEKEKFKKPNQAANQASTFVERKKFLIDPFHEISGLVMIFILMGLMARDLTGKSSAHVAAYFVFFLVLRRSTALFGSISRVRAVFASMCGTLVELEEVFSSENKFYVTEGDKVWSGLQNEIRFERVNFEYPSRTRVLKNVSFEVKKGRMTALVGPTGAGKTTLLHLLMRFYESPPGSILADGQDLRDFSLRSYHDRVAFISQDPLLFNDTIRFNLIYGLATEPSEEKVITILKQARCYDFTTKLPEGLDTVIGDRGSRLSKGERQRLSIARALLRNAEVLVLDEATSALDSETERLIQEALMEAIHGKTTLVVAHRFSTIRHADHIVVLDNGCVVETGTLQHLLEAKGLFWRLWEAQRFY